MQLLRSRQSWILALVCLVCTAAVAVLYATVFAYQEQELRFRDNLIVYGKKTPIHPDIVFLAIDSASTTLDQLFKDDEAHQVPAIQLMKQGWPWPREVYAPIIDRLAAAGARVIALDLLFPTEREGDAKFRAALDRHRDRVVIGSNLIEVEQDQGNGTINLKPTLVPPTPSLIAPPGFKDSRVGYVNFRPDVDGKVRRAHFNTTLLEYFNNPAAQYLQGLEEDSIGTFGLSSLAARIAQKSNLSVTLPTDRAPRLFRYSRELRPRSIHEIFIPSLWAAPPYNSGELFRDKIVLIGPEGNWTKDELDTPFGMKLGPQIHLAALNALISGEFLTETSLPVDLVLIGLAGGLAWLLTVMVRQPSLRLGLLFASPIPIIGIAFLLYNTLGILPVLLSPLLALTSSGIGASTVEWALDRREKTRIRRTFERYVSKDVVKEVLDNPQSFLNSLGGERRPVTVLFSDVRGFTTATESADPAQLVTQLNEYFREMVRIVRVETRGTLDKFIGDAVMAHWGSIVTRGPKADACSAVAAALAMRRELKRLNEEWAKNGQLDFKIGIGINQGEVIVGNIGSEERAEVSVIGDAVNLASRLEGVTKPYRVDLCIGESVAELVRDTFILRSLDMIVVKGKTKPVEVFTVLDRRSPKHPEPIWLSTHEEAMKLYRQGEFADAARCWRDVLAQNPGDGVAQLFIERCEALQITPPDQPWTGVFQMKDK